MSDECGAGRPMEGLDTGPAFWEAGGQRLPAETSGKGVGIRPHSPGFLGGQIPEEEAPIHGFSAFPRRRKRDANSRIPSRTPAGRCVIGRQNGCSPAIGREGMTHVIPESRRYPRHLPGKTRNISEGYRRKFRSDIIRTAGRSLHGSVSRNNFDQHLILDALDLDRFMKKKV